jgi:hypothetical protein
MRGQRGRSAVGQSAPGRREMSASRDALVLTQDGMQVASDCSWRRAMNRFPAVLPSAVHLDA